VIELGYSRALLAQGVERFLLTEVRAPVFGDTPGTPTGVYSLHYEARQVCKQASCPEGSIVPPAGWPALGSDSGLPDYLPFLVRVELPADASGARLTHTFDYSPSGEMSELRTPSGGRTTFSWGDERITANPSDSEPTAYPVARVIRQKSHFPDPYAAAAAHTWSYLHNSLPDSEPCGSIGVHDRWRTLVTDPEGNDTEYRFYTTGSVSYSQRQIWTPKNGAAGAVKQYKGQAKRYVDGAANFSELDPNFPNNGVTVRGTFYRYRYHADANTPEPIHVLGTQTVFYDDRLTSAVLSLDPNAPSGAACLAMHEMDHAVGEEPLQGYAWHAEANDPNHFYASYAFGANVELVKTRFGNLVGPEAITIRGEGEDICPSPASNLFGGIDRRILKGGAVVESSQTGELGCIKRKNPALTYDATTRSTLFTGDVARKDTLTGGLLTSVRHQGGDPISSDPNAVGVSGLSYTQEMVYSSGVLSRQGMAGTSWYSYEATIDPASALASSRKDSAGIQTTLTYDRLGRLVSSAPPAPEIATEVSYPAETQSFVSVSGATRSHVFSRSVEVLRGASSDPAHIFARSEYDGAGRLKKEIRRHADGSLVQRTHAYDGLDAPVFSSEWHAPSVTNPPGTTISYRDGDAAFPPLGRREPFSRPLKVTDPNTNTQEYAYFGLNDSVTVKKINYPATVTDSATTVT
jgi:hypothetical protein